MKRIMWKKIEKRKKNNGRNKIEKLKKKLGKKSKSKFKIRITI